MSKTFTTIILFLPLFQALQIPSKDELQTTIAGTAVESYVCGEDTKVRKNSTSQLKCLQKMRFCELIHFFGQE